MSLCPHGDYPDLCHACGRDDEINTLRAKLQAADVEKEDILAQRDVYLSRAEAAEAEVARLDPAYVNGLQARFADQSARVAELEAVLAEVVRISDRKHDAWDRAHALLDGRGE